MTTATPISPLPPPSNRAAFPHQGDCIRLADGEQLYQVIGVDAPHDRCWLRAWPLGRHGSQVFEISLQQVMANAHHRPGQPS